MKSVPVDSRTSAKSLIPGDCQERLQGFADGYAVRTGDDRLRDILDGSEPDRRERLDAISTRLMEAYKDTADEEAFTLLYELNQESFLRLIYYYVQRSYYPVSARDILQEVFFNIYRYPHKFKPDWNSAFRNWSNSIIRNTVFKYGKRAQKERLLSLDSDNPELEESHATDLADGSVLPPLDRAANHEEEECLSRAWAIYLHFYLQAYRYLAPREKRVIYLVEVENLPYRDVAEQIGVPSQNLKMMVFRARKRIYKIMKRKLQGGIANLPQG